MAMTPLDTNGIIHAQGGNGMAALTGWLGRTRMSSQVRLLVVEDDAEMRSLLAQLLAADGYDVRAVGDSRDAMHAVAREEPDLVLLDIMLGDEDGREVLKELRRMSDVPVVFLTARSHEI